MSEVQNAINVISDALKRMADGAETCPDVHFDVQWMDVTTIGGRREWIPRVSLRASVTQEVSIADL